MFHVPRFLAKEVPPSLAGMRTQVVHRQVDGVGLRIMGGDVQKAVRKLGCRAAGRHPGKMPPCLRHPHR